MTERMVVDEITLICKQCGAEHVQLLDKVLTGAEELIAWMKAHVFKFCECNATTCDVKATLRNPEVLNSREWEDSQC
jgi:hypothetical protein